jgi:Sulfotransferase family
MQHKDKVGRKYVFVCGLQRSGTTVLARNIGRFEGCTKFRNTGVVQDEGQYLQTIYPADVVFGGTGTYGFNPRAHLTEASELLTAENIARLRASWHAHWDETKPICLEKTPSNLIMTRFLQAAFPTSYFIVIRRHPVAVSMASQKWSMMSLHRLFQHWLRCYHLFEQDKPHLNNVYELRYEDYVAQPGLHHLAIAKFIATTVGEEAVEAVTGAHNRRYLERWLHLLEHSGFRSYYRYIAAKYDWEFRKYGYSLVEPFKPVGTRSVLRSTADSRGYCRPAFGA